MKGTTDNPNGGKSMTNLTGCLLLNLFYVLLQYHNCTECIIIIIICYGSFF